MPASARSAKPTPPGSRRALLAERANKILDVLETAHPEATCALHHRNPYELVMATILSAQCTDEMVNRVTPALFARYPDAHALAVARAEDVEELVRPTGFYRAKTRSLLGCARALASEHGGEVPRSMEAMVESRFSSGVATAAAIVSGLAPGSSAVIVMVGKSTAGRSETGKVKYASVPKHARPAVSSAVAIGRRTKIAERFIRSWRGA